MRNKPIANVNADLLKERKNCSFDIEELTNLIDGGKNQTARRREIENMLLKNMPFDIIPEECLSAKEKYENAVRKSVALNKIGVELVSQVTKAKELSDLTLTLRRVSDAYFREVTPFLLHLGMFIPTILGQCSDEQVAHWLPLAMQLKIIGTYAQTELGHGTFIRGLETTATYDERTEEFVLNSPTLSSSKWWAGGLGKTANHCIVVAQLYTKGECYGTHPFIVQIRDMDTHMPLKGLKVGEIGPRLGFQTADNGFLVFDNFRIPRDSLMMKHAKVLKDGTYVKIARHSKLTYGTMIFVRVLLVSEMAFNLSKAVTIAVRYSAVRRQSELKPNEPEPQVLDYLTQQHKLFISISTVYAFQFTSNWLMKTYHTVQANMKHGNTDALPELHALSSCLKAICTSDCSAAIEQCRFACGGHGYMISSNLPSLYAFTTATRTYEGDYTVLLLQTARFLVKTWEQVELGNAVTPMVAYLARHQNREAWDESPEGIIRAFEAIAAGVYQTESVRSVSFGQSDAIKDVMKQLSDLYLLYWSLERTGDLLTTLKSTLGSYDGRVYERLMEEALKSPLNQEPVNESFHKYLKPTMNKL
ncbi:unnamed protein product [Diatraea saccharalis]|uniref:Acyl-coenzyme A oxidase n=1 Tax=Diatraea saccharalis TaxID=40085 RepID=A0A9N9RFM9_9NEOP|nr:unnamed protein product [Diatraea saccharalis]